MVFSSPTFLFVFFPAAFALYACCPRHDKHVLLFLLSILFYSWGDPTGIVYLLFSIVINFLFGCGLQRSRSPRTATCILLLGLLVNLAGLGTLKYAAFFVRSLNMTTGMDMAWNTTYLPLGISFFTFHAISYLVDVWRKKREAQYSILQFGLYLSFFPQLLAGPILRYADFGSQLDALPPTMSLDDLHEGLKRFILGLSKKTLLADPLSLLVDPVFNVSPHLLSPQLAWMGLLCYGLQIYFDFSGYSDMAIGLGRLFGFRLPENFRTPYLAVSVTDFWRRWHISLMAWLSEYIYVPLGGSRLSSLRTGFNIMLVFTLSGLWHGAGWHFVFWGMYFGGLLLLEKFVFARLLERTPLIVRHALTMLLIFIGWVFFRSPTLAYAFRYLAVLAGISGEGSFVSSLAVGVLPLLAVTIVLCEGFYGRISNRMAPISLHLLFFECIEDMGWFALFILSLGAIAVRTYHPFLYFQF